MCVLKSSLLRQNVGEETPKTVRIDFKKKKKLLKLTQSWQQPEECLFKKNGRISVKTVSFVACSKYCSPVPHFPALQEPGK